MSQVANAGLIYGGGYEIANSTVSLAGSSSSGGGYTLLYSVGQHGYSDFFQTPGNYTTGYMIESGYVSGIEAVFSQFTFNSSVTAPVAFGYLGGASDPVPGARVTYQLLYGNAGEAAVNSTSGAALGYSNMPIEIQVPSDLQYEAGTITLGGVPQTDANDFPGVDSCSYDSGTGKIICIVLMTAGATGNIQFSAVIK